MSLDQQPEMTQQNAAANAGNGQNAEGLSTPEAPVSAAVENFRRGFTDAQSGLMMALGEEPQDYRRMMESLVDDLQPRAGIEAQIVEQMGQSVWRMRRAQRIQDGLALKRIQSRLEAEQMAATDKAWKVIEHLRPFESLEEALARRDRGPTAAEINDFVKSRKGDSSEEMEEFILLLRSLLEPMEGREPKAALKKARAELRRLMERYESVGWVYSRRAQEVGSPENLAALMAPDDHRAVLAQRMEDASLRRFWRLTNAFAKVRQGALHPKKDVKNDVRSPNVFENKQNMDKMPDANADNYAA